LVGGVTDHSLSENVFLLGDEPAVLVLVPLPQAVTAKATEASSRGRLRRIDMTDFSCESEGVRCPRAGDTAPVAG
jgi:hypothetical protein